MQLIGLLFNFVNNAWFWMQKHFFLSCIILFIVMLPYFKINLKKSKNFLNQKTGMIIIDWKFWKWKNKFMTTLANESKKKNYFVLSNFYTWYTNIRWNSLSDLESLLYDVWKLWEYQNFTYIELQRMYKWEWKKRLKEKMKVYRDIEKTYKNIPKNWYHNSFLFLCDEFQNLFFNRASVSNFSWENKSFLKYLHQVRHFNSLLVFATQKEKELDVKFRRLSTFYIEMKDWVNGFFYGYDVRSFETDKRENLDKEKATKFTKLPAVFLNWYMFNLVLNKIEKRISKIIKKEFKFKFRFFELDFFSKFNADPDYNIYKKWDLFRYLDNYYKEKKDFKTLWLN